MKQFMTLLALIYIAGAVLYPATASAEWKFGPQKVYKDPAVDDFVYRINYLGFSEHHGSTNTTNETHNGLGISVTLPNNMTFGYMNYTNSYDKNSNMLSLSTEFLHNGNLHIGIGGGYVTGYEDEQEYPLLGWGSVRYKWLLITAVPGEVTAVGLTIPLEAIKRVFR